MTDARSFIVVGGSPAAMWAALELAELGHAVRLISARPLERARSGHSVLAVGGDLSADVAEHAGSILHTLDRMGVPFDRTPEGRVFQHAVGPTMVATAGPLLGVTVHRALEQQVRAGHLAPRIQILEHEHLLGLVLDGGVCRGISTVHAFNNAVHVHVADGVCLADEGWEGLLALHTSGSGQGQGTLGAVVMQGLALDHAANVLHHPLTVAGADCPRALPLASLLLGARDARFAELSASPWLPVDEGTLDVPRAARAALTPLLEREWRLSRTRPPFAVRSSVHRMAGGLRVDARMATSTPRLYAAGAMVPSPSGERWGHGLLRELTSARVAARALATEDAAGPFDTNAAEEAWRTRCAGYAAHRGSVSAQLLSEGLGDVIHAALGGGGATAPFPSWRERLSDVDGRCGAAAVHALHASAALAERVLDAVQPRRDAPSSQAEAGA